MIFRLAVTAVDAVSTTICPRSSAYNRAKYGWTEDFNPAVQLDVEADNKHTLQGLLRGPEDVGGVRDNGMY